MVVSSARDVSAHRFRVPRGLVKLLFVRLPTPTKKKHASLAVAYQVILEPGMGQFREIEPRQVHTRINSLGLFHVHKLTCEKRESVSEQHSMKNRRAVGLLNPVRDKN